MNIKIQIYDDKNGYSIDIRTRHNALIKQERCNNLMELANFVTDILSVQDFATENIVDWFIAQYLNWSDIKKIPPPRIIYEQFEEWYVYQRRKKLKAFFDKIIVKRSQP